jgi:hypothetical protein
MPTFKRGYLLLLLISAAACTGPDAPTTTSAPTRIASALATTPTPDNGARSLRGRNATTDGRRVLVLYS